MKKLKLILFIIPLLFVNGCNESTTETTTNELINTEWVLESFEVNGIIEIPPNTQTYSIQFKADNSHVGQNDCNSFFGDYIVKSNSIIINNLVTTEVYCGKESMDFRYFEALSGAVSYAIEKNELEINYQTNSKLKFIAK